MLLNSYYYKTICKKQVYFECCLVPNALGNILLCSNGLRGRSNAFNFDAVAVRVRYCCHACGNWFKRKLDFFFWKNFSRARVCTFKYLISHRMEMMKKKKKSNEEKMKTIEPLFSCCVGVYHEFWFHPRDF